MLDHLSECSFFLFMRCMILINTVMLFPFLWLELGKVFFKKKYFQNPPVNVNSQTIDCAISGILGTVVQICNFSKLCLWHRSPFLSSM